MIGTDRCVYETPCGWCSKWDKECDKKIPSRGHRVKIKPVDDDINDGVKKYLESELSNKICKQESDHEWECYSVSTLGNYYVCKKCGANKFVDVESLLSDTPVTL